MKAKFILILLFTIVSLNIEAAEHKFKFSKLSIQYRMVSAEKSTIVGLDRGKLKSLGRARDWGMIEAIFNSAPSWADDVEVKYYVLMKGDSKKGPVMLAGSITYIYVQKGRGHISTIYVAPPAIMRYGNILKIRAELWYNGILEDSIQWPKGAGKAQWWNKVKPIYGSLFNRFYTPFEHEMQMLEELIKIQ